MTENSPAKPILPTINDVNRPFWEGCASGKLLVQRCTQCGRLRYPAGVVCPECLGPEAEWQPMSGRGKVFSFIVFHRAYHKAWESKVPYVVAMIELDEGPMLISNVVNVDATRLKVDDPVMVDYEPVDDDIVMPVFRPAS
jgi:uncharacterized OB-fold protein